MKFIDEALITVEAGKGGNGACSFLRLKFMPFGGPDGGNGGDGGSIYLMAHEKLNTLIDYRYIRQYKAEDGNSGSGRNCTGKSGKDLLLEVPVGTMIYDADTNELIADLTQPEQKECVAKGGRHGVGNAAFKSSINRSPRRTIPGAEGEKRNLRLELKVLADVGLVGMPNAGKSTLISALSSARPKIADYPFTTLYPNLGVVRVGQFNSFVIADLPGLIEGAAEGAGLGIQFLKHVSRTALLLHVVDASPFEGQDLIQNIKTITKELEEYSSDLKTKERWLVLNKVDLLPKEDLASLRDNVITQLNWKKPLFLVSGLTKTGLTDLVHHISVFLTRRLDEEEMIDRG